MLRARAEPLATLLFCLPFLLALEDPNDAEEEELNDEVDDAATKEEEETGADEAEAGATTPSAEAG
jgi:hypothetical protein